MKYVDVIGEELPVPWSLPKERDLVPYAACCIVASTNLTELQVKEFLGANPSFLDEVILEVASREQIERWLIRKTHLISTSGPDNTIHADRFSLYLVDKNGSPIIQSDGTLVGVVELVKALGSMPFEKEDEEILNSYLVWGSIAIHHAEISKQITKQKDLNTFLLNVVRSIFDEVCTMDTVIEKIMAFAKKLVNADRCSLFLLDQASEELFANLFDDGNEDGSFRCGNEI
ncbi:predicted protein, partial [Nematostella vectensis]